MAQSWFMRVPSQRGVAAVAAMSAGSFSIGVRSVISVDGSIRAGSSRPSRQKRNLPLPRGWMLNSPW
jgi:hypothetical protein